MRLYRNDDMTSPDQWAGTQDDANRLFGRGRWQQVEVPTDKPGLLGFLANLAQEAIWPPTATHPAPAAANPVEPAPRAAIVSLATDEAFEALPMAHQLHLAALALENARSRIKPA